MAVKGDDVKWKGIPMKYIALVLLTVQNSALILVSSRGFFRKYCEFLWFVEYMVNLLIETRMSPTFF